ncbi:iron chaperone (plasmid) [Coraliomargarita sp. W4R53]
MGTIDDYLDTLDETDREAIEYVYDIARELVPEAEQGKGYGMPALVYKGKSLIAVMRTEKGISLYPFSPEAITAARDDLGRFGRDKGTVRFQSHNLLPSAAIRTLVFTRRAEIDG